MAAKYTKSPGLLVSYQAIAKGASGEAVKTRGEIHYEGKKVLQRQDNNQVVTDGKTTWMYLASVNEITISNNDPSDRVEFMNLFSCALCAQSFNLSRVEHTVFNGAPHYTFELQPKKRARDSKSVRLFVKKKGLSLSGWKLTTPEDQFTLTVISVKPRDTMPASYFRIDIERFPGAREVDLRYPD